MSEFINVPGGNRTMNQPPLYDSLKISKNMSIKSFLSENSDIMNFVESKSGNSYLKVLKYLQEFDCGTFFEAGATDGIFESNTRILEELGWNGILVEPFYDWYSKCLTNRSAISVHAALVSDNSKKSIRMNEIGIDQSGSFIVPASTITDILIENNMLDITFFSLDIEGYEIEALNGLDFSKINVEYFLIEVNSDKYTLDFINNYMLERGYENISNISDYKIEFGGSDGESCYWNGSYQDYLYRKIKNNMRIADILMGYDTDKNKGSLMGGPGSGHFYGESYDRIFENFERSSNVSILEIGVQKGGSILAWKDYFQNAYVVGIDIVDDRLEESKRDDVHFILSDIKNGALRNNSLLETQFDIIIDDGSHYLYDVIYVVQNYLDKLKLNGYLIIEDCQDPYGWLENVKSMVNDDYIITTDDVRNINGNYDDFLIIIKRVK
jgi:FkbM family methyltransferase